MVLQCILINWAALTQSTIKSLSRWLGGSNKYKDDILLLLRGWWAWCCRRRWRTVTLLLRRPPRAPYSAPMSPSAERARQLAVTGALHPPSFFSLFRPRTVSPRTDVSSFWRCVSLLSHQSVYSIGHEFLYNVTINLTAGSCYPLHMSCWSYWKIWYRGTLTQCRKNISGTFLIDNLTIQKILHWKVANNLLWP
jgi:hypothetical protein